MSFLKEALKVAGTLGGAYLGGPVGGIAGRGLSGLLTGEDTDSLIKNSLIFGTGAGAGMNYASPFLEGMPGYGAGSELWSKYMPNFLGGGTDGAFTEGDTDMLIPKSDSAGPGGNFLSNIGSWAKDNPMLAMMGVGVGSDLLAGGKKKEAEQESLAKYFADTTWNPETRTAYQTGISGTYSDLLAGKQRRTAAQSAEAGRGGGFFSNQTKKDQNAVNEAIAKVTGATYTPSNTPLSAYQAKASADTPAYIDTLSGLSETMGKMLPYYYMSQMMGRN